LGVGLGAFMDEIGPMKSGQVTADVSYTIDLDEKGTRLAFGMKAGFSQIDIDGARLNWYQPNDPAYHFAVRNKTSPVIGAGFFMYNKNWYVGISTPNFLATKYG